MIVHSKDLGQVQAFPFATRQDQYLMAAFYFDAQQQLWKVLLVDFDIADRWSKFSSELAVIRVYESFFIMDQIAGREEKPIIVMTTKARSLLRSTRPVTKSLP